MLRPMSKHVPPAKAAGPVSWESLYTGHPQDYAPPDASMLERVSKLTPQRALDVGCGAGGLCIALSELGWQVTGVDVAHNAIAAARQVARARGVTVTFVADDAARWQPSGSYELVTCHFGLPPDPSDRQAIYHTVRRATAVGGVVLMKFCEGNVSKIPALAGYDALTVEELSRAFEGFELAPPEYLRIPSHLRRGRQRVGPQVRAPLEEGEEYWTAVLFEGRKPL